MAAHKGTPHATPDVRRAQILEAALRCFSERGYGNTTMDDVVHASGLSKGSLYRFFRSKDEVFLALFDTFESEIFASWDRVAAETDDALELLRLQGEIVVGTLGGQHSLLRAWVDFFVHRGLRERFAHLYREARKRTAAALRRGVASGQLRKLDTARVAAGFVGAIEGLLLQAMVDADFDARRHWPPLWEVMRKGLLP